MTNKNNEIREGHHHRHDDSGIDESSLNEELQSVISDHWEKNQTPGFTGYQTSKDSDSEQEVRLKDTTTSRNTSGHSRVNTKEEKKRRKNKKKASKASRIIKIVIAAILAIALVAGGTFAYMKSQGKKAAQTNDDSGEKIQVADDAISENDGKTVKYKGVTYRYNNNISTILFLGIDKESYEDDVEHGDAGQCDTIFFTAINHKTGETKMIPISRNTMANVDQYNADGSYWRQQEIQIATAFAYGDGKESSCLNAAKAVSRFMYGMPVNKYIAIDISSINALNDALGGVEVEVLEDLTNRDPELVKGQKVVLKGEQAETYVRTRKTTITDESQDNNAARMERQKQYLGAFMNKALTQTKKNPLLPIHLLNEINDDALTDITPSEIVYYATLLVDKGFNNSIVNIPGKVKRGKYTEVHADKEALYQIVLDTFYERD